MNIKKALTRVLNILIVGSIIAILYLFVGRGWVEFDRDEVLKIATEINKLCNDNGSCPTKLEGWEVLHEGRAALKRDMMIYYPISADEDASRQDNKDYQSFRLVYSFFMPDDWFEVQGGVNRQLTSGRKSK